MTLDLNRLKSLHAAATQGEWEYRPGEFDDWGFIRGPVNPHGEQWLVAQSRPGEYLTDEQYDQHRMNTTDPCKPNGLAICALHNAAPSLIARAEEADRLLAERDRLRKALERIARPLDCGCVPCRGDCESPDALKITVEEHQEIARAALAKEQSNG